MRGTTLSHSTVLLLVPPKAVSKVTQDVYKRVLDHIENALERMKTIAFQSSQGQGTPTCSATPRAEPQREIDLDSMSQL